MFKKYLAITLLFVVTISLGISQDRKTIKFVDDYLSVAFWNVQGVDQPLIKWAHDSRSLKYKVVGEFQYLSEKAWNKYIAELESLTGISLIRTDQNDFNILVFFGELQNYAEFTDIQIPLETAVAINNWSNRKWNSNYQLSEASYCLVPSKIINSQEGIYRLKKGMLKSLGILGESDKDYSIFYKFPVSANRGISRNDKRFIKLHYNKSVKAGDSMKSTRNVLLNLPNIKELAKAKL